MGLNSSLRASPTVSVELKFPVELNLISGARRSENGGVRKWCQTGPAGPL